MDNSDVWCCLESSNLLYDKNLRLDYPGKMAQMIYLLQSFWTPDVGQNIFFTKQTQMKTDTPSKSLIILFSVAVMAILFIS